MRTAAIIGGGVIGGGWAARFALMGWRVRVYDPDPEAARKIGAVMEGAARALPMLYDVALPPRGEIRFCETLAEAVAEADWVQESVPERIDLKTRVFAEIGVHARPDALIGTSTSGFKPSELQDNAGAIAPRLMVAHPFNPVYLLPLVELVPGSNVAPDIVEKAKTILTGIGMYPLHVRAEIDAHIADRLLESVWREALWLVKDGIATTEEIDNSIRYGFGLRWAQMGLFETYRIAGGEAGMAHFLDQFGPCLAWPWSRLTEVPDFTPELVQLIAGQSDAQSGHLDIRALERQRDDNLVALLRALRQQGTAAGKLLIAHEKTLRTAPSSSVPMVTQTRRVPVDWTDVNGHMNEGRFGQVFSDASEELMRRIGADEDYIAAGHSYFTAETTIKYLAECHAGDAVQVTTCVTLGEGKKLRLFHEMRRDPEGDLLATCDQFLLHVSLKTRRSCPPLPEVAARLERLATEHTGA
ncbi:carnitine 3-dehydrogenase [Thalassococcus profundi]|uniref:L-carnitine dehydrogenase n=1 Tax=Thalassococcus profundi TaxID=2282382 RepID=A0A369TPF1_9RHOB|nr:carnitine 3-dehydrogenase [Thalassococcus profundi]RDD66574.1 carnitine 3-dehydrogenase [Thalassococcus profundi]